MRKMIAAFCLLALFATGAAGMASATPKDFPHLREYADLSDDERVAAMTVDFMAMLEEKVANGELTQEQADHMLEMFAAGPPSGAMPHSRREGKDEEPRTESGFRDIGPDGRGFDSTSRLPDMSKYEGMEDEERVAAMTADFVAMLEEKVASGELTQEQADNMLERFSVPPSDIHMERFKGFAADRAFPDDGKPPMERGMKRGDFPVGRSPAVSEPASIKGTST